MACIKYCQCLSNDSPRCKLRRTGMRRHKNIDVRTALEIQIVVRNYLAHSNLFCPGEEVWSGADRFTSHCALWEPSAVISGGISSCGMPIASSPASMSNNARSVLESWEGWVSHHSVRISDRYVDNTMTLYRLRRPSGRPPDYTLYLYYTGRRNDIQYV